MTTSIYLLLFLLVVKLTLGEDQGLENNPFRIRELLKAELRIREVLEELAELEPEDKQIQNDVGR